jgi:hypothetical protein
VGFEEVTLWVLNDNLRARNWYESRGWDWNGKTKTEITGGFTSTLFGIFEASLESYWHALACVAGLPEDQGVVPLSFIAALTPDRVALNITYQRIAIGISAEPITNMIPKGAK